MIEILIVAALIWSALSPDRVASPVRAAAVAAARGAGQTGRSAAADRWARGADGRATRRKQRSKTRAGRAVNAAGTGLAGLGRILQGATGTAGAAVAGAARAAGYEFADARELHRWHRREHGSRFDDVARLVLDTFNPIGQSTSLGQRIRDFVRDLPGILRPNERDFERATGCVGCGRRTADVVHRHNGETLCWGCYRRAAHAGGIDPADYDFLTGTDRHERPTAPAADQPQSPADPAAQQEQPSTPQPSEPEKSAGPSPEEQALQAHHRNLPIPPPAPAADATAEQIAQYERDRALYEAEKAKWEQERDRLRAARDAARAAQAAAVRARAEAAAARLAANAAGVQDPAVDALLAGLATASPEEAARLLADAPDDVVARAAAWQDAAQNSLPAGEGSNTNPLENTDMAPTTTLDVPNADALLLVAKAFSAAAEAASHLQAIAMNAQNLPDALGYGPGTKVLQVIMQLAELAPDPKQLGEFAETLPRLEQALRAQLNRNEVIDSDGLTGEATKHTTS